MTPTGSQWPIVCYLDESATDDSVLAHGVLGGVAMNRRDVPEFEHAWTMMLVAHDVQGGLHMREFGPHGRLAHITGAAKGALLTDAVQIINHLRIFTIGAAVHNREYESQISPVVRRKFMSVYGIAFLMAVVVNNKTAQEHGYLGKIDFILDKGNRYKSHVAAAHEAIVGSSELSEFQVGGLCFDSDAGNLPLQAADVVAWAARRQKAGSSLEGCLSPLQLLFDEAYADTRLTSGTIQMLNERFAVAEGRAPEGGSRPPRARRVYLDSNAISYCLWPRPGSAWTASGLETLRTAIEADILNGRLAIVGSQFHVEEASRMRPDLRHQWMKFFWNAVLWNLLLPTHELAKLEASMRRPLQANEPFDEVERRWSIRGACLRNGSTLLDALAPEVQSYAKTFAAEQVKRREAMRLEMAAQFANKTPHQITTSWWADSTARIRDWTYDYIRQSKHHLNLSGDESSWPAPEQLPTAWNMHAYQMARIVMTVGLQAKIGDGDAHDAHHYAGACYADILVTHDKGFRDTVGLIPSPLRLMSLEDFALTLGVAQR